MTPTLDPYGDCILWPERDGPITDTLWAMDMRAERTDHDAVAVFGNESVASGWYVTSPYLGVHNDPPGRNVAGPYETLDVVLTIAAMQGYFPNNGRTALALPGLFRD